MDREYITLGPEKIRVPTDRTWDIHGLHYEGKSHLVTPEDQAYYDAEVRDILDDTKHIGLSTQIWLVYAVKYITAAQALDRPDKVC